MKFTIAVIVLCALQNLLVLGRTPDEVIAEFEPLILQLGRLLVGQSFEFGSEIGQYYPKEYQKTVDELFFNINMGVYSNNLYIEQKVGEVVAEYNMTSHDDKIQHCFVQKDTGKGRLNQTVLAGQDVCWKLAAVDSDNFKNILQGYIQKMNPTHVTLLRTVDTCKKISENGLDMVSCLIEHLLVQLAPQVGQTLKDMKTDMLGMSSIVTERLNRISPCFNFVGEKSDEIMKEVIDGFRKCVVASQNN